MSSKRRSYEAGHKPQVLVVIDDTAGMRSRRLLRRAAAPRRTGASIVMLRVIEPRRSQSAMARRRRHHEGGGAARRKRRARLNSPQRATTIAGITPERVIREGDKAEEILKLIDEDEDIAHPGAGRRHRQGGPGPLGLEPGQDRRQHSRSRSRIVPGDLSDEEITRCAGS